MSKCFQSGAGIRAASVFGFLAFRLKDISFALFSQECVHCVTSCKEILWNSWVCFLPQNRPASVHVTPTSADLPFLLLPPPRLDNDGIDLLMSFLKVSITEAWRWCGRFESHVWTVWWDRSWLLTSFLFPISVRVKKEDLCWWSNETTLLQEPGATCARTAREWVMAWRCRRADLATSARYNSKDIRARITYRLIRDTLISWNYVICGALTVFHVWQTSPYSHWRRSSCRGIPVTGTHRTQNQVRIKVPETSILDIRCPRRASQDV